GGHGGVPQRLVDEDAGEIGQRRAEGGVGAALVAHRRQQGGGQRVVHGVGAHEQTIRSIRLLGARESSMRGVEPRGTTARPNRWMTYSAWERTDGGSTS